MSQPIDLRIKEIPEEPVQTVGYDTDSPSDIRWSTHISPPLRRDRVMYISIGLCVSAFLVAFFAHDFLFTIVLVLAAAILVLHAWQPHHPSEIRIHATGIAIDDEHHHYADIKSFWIEYQPYIKEVSIEFKKGYTPLMRIPLEDVNPLEIRQAMISYVPEKEHELSLLDHIIRLIEI